MDHCHPLRFALTENEELRKPSVWFFSLPKGPRDADGDLPNVKAGDLALVLAYRMAMKIDGMDVVSANITVGIVISHNKTLWYLQEKFRAIRNRIQARKNLSFVLH